MREWVGDRVVQNLMTYGYTIKNKKFESTVSVAREDIEDDQYGVYAPIVQMMGESAANYPDELIFELMNKGFTYKCYDGQPFFSSSHITNDNVTKKITISNMGTAPLSASAYTEARAQMMGLVDNNGKILKIRPNLLVVPPSLESEGRKLLMADVIDGTTNVYKDTAELLVVQELTVNPTAWYLLDTSKPVKPFIFQERIKPEFISLDNPKDGNVFFNAQYIYGVNCRGNAGYGLWQLAYGSTGTGK